MFDSRRSRSLLAGLRARLVGNGGRVEVKRDSPNLLLLEMSEESFLSDLKFARGPVRVRVPIEHLRYYGGLPYKSERHPFYAFYESGTNALKQFYDFHQPANLLEAHFKDSGHGGDPPSGFELPWIKRAAPKRNFGERGLQVEHGRQHFGPVSREKIALEARRLMELRASIERYGYLPEKFGYPKGYFLEAKDGQLICLVNSGQHRIAALAHLGIECVEIDVHPMYPRVVSQSDTKLWPAVRAGLQGELAEQIFRAYFS